MLSNIVFEVVVKIPDDTQIKQVIANHKFIKKKKKTLNVEAIFILPEGFQLALLNRIPSEFLKKR